MIKFNCPQCNHTLKVPEEAAGKIGTCKRCGEQLNVPASATFQEPETDHEDSDQSIQPKPNKFIEAFRSEYNESLRLLDEEPSQLVKNGANLSGIIKFSEHAGKIPSIYDYLKSLYSLIYSSSRILEHFKSSKLDIKRLPLSFILEKESLDEEHLELYEEELKTNYTKYLDEYDDFQPDAFNEYFVRKLLDESGYNKKHWHFKDMIINEIEFMFDYLLEFVEEEYNPIIDEDDQKNEDDNKKDRYISKTTRLAVWRRDLGKCVQCGSQEKLEYDHIIPVSKGGSNTERNIQLLCEKCNRTKSNSI